MLKQIVKPLLSWYDGHARVLPWRENRHPYRVWVSEIMLQQTRVEAVKPFFERFIKALPDVKSLAECPEDELLKLWEGLGYYNRVRNMQKAAQTVMEQYGGAFPADYEKLLSLPGIGHYTAGAIGSIAFDIPMPAVDGNVLRVLARVKASYEDILKQSVKSSMEKEVRKIIPADRAGDFNQALIELGAIVCVPNGKARCGACPLAFCCMDHFQKIAELTKELPNLEGFLVENEVLEWIRKQGLSPLRILPLAGAKHIFSHVEWQMTGYAVSLEETEHMDRDGLFFTDAKETEEKYPIPAAFAAYARYMNIVLGQERYEER